jgi:peptidoglycan-associated lipoprotein
VAGADGKAGAAGAAGASSTGMAQSSVATVDLSKPAGGNSAAMAGPAERVVLFDFDSYIIKDEYRSLVEGHAKALAASRNRRMSVEGHTDERGGREYNLALGQRRAEAVSRAMVLLGAGETQVEATSFGKERPVALGHDEAAWAQNRRAELKDR